MRKCWLVLVALLVVLCINACSSSNTGSIPAPDGSGRNSSFAVSAEDGLGTFQPVLRMEEASGLQVAKIYAQQATELEAAYVNLSYDGMSYSPERVEFSDLLGNGEEVLTLALTNVKDVVPIGVAQIAGKGEPVNGDGLLATVYFRSSPFMESRSASDAPNNAINAVDDLKIINQQPGSVTLAWTERNVGDYDNNGEVTISDLTPIALLYGQLVATAADPTWAGLVDGDSNGEINSADITPIGVNFGNRVAGYDVYSDETGSALIGETGTCSCERTTFFINCKSPVQYAYIAETDETTFTVRPVDDVGASATAGIISNVALIVNVPGPPDAPANLVAETGETIGHQTVQLSWDAPAQEDVSGYQIERKASADGDGAWAMIQQVGSKATSYTDTDTALLEVSYDYRVRAKDFTELYSDYSNVASATPFFLPAPSPPVNLTSSNEIPTGNSIELHWDAPMDGTAIRFFVFAKGPGESEFTQIGGTPNGGITSYLHTNLTEFETYEYYVTSVGVGGVQSVPSNTTSNTPSGAAAIEITSLSTDKWTHFADGGDDMPATFTVVTNVPPDSVDWDCSVGSVTGSGATVTYKPPAGTSPQVVTVTCTVHKGTGQAVDSFKQYLTANRIWTAGSGGGKHMEVSGFASVKNPTAPYMDFSSLFEGEGHVVIMTKWGVWCIYCKLEMPDFQSYVAQWKDQGMYVHGLNFWDADGGASWLNANGCPDIDTYIVTQNFTQQWQDNSGITMNVGSAPANLVVDRDGYIRKAQEGSLTYNPASKAATEKLLKELLGVS